MEAAGSTERFERAPTGRWVSGGSLLVWNWSPRLGGMVAWGQPSEGDIQGMFRLVDAYHRAAPGCDVVTDVSRVQSLQAPAFDVLLSCMRERIEMFRAMPRHALVRPRGMVAAMTEGIFHLLSTGHPVRVFGDPTEAYDWVRQPDGRRAGEELGPLVDRCMAVTPEVQKLREFLSVHLRSARASEAARALGLSERSLHRALEAAGTGYRGELESLRMEEARRLLADTDRKIESIARAVGFASHAPFAAAFRRHAKETPSEYRARLRPRGRG